MDSLMDRSTPPGGPPEAPLPTPVDLTVQPESPASLGAAAAPAGMMGMYAKMKQRQDNPVSDVSQIAADETQGALDAAKGQLSQVGGSSEWAAPVPQAVDPMAERQAAVMRAVELTGFKGILTPETEEHLLATVNRVEAEKQQQAAELKLMTENPQEYQAQQKAKIDAWAREHGFGNLYPSAHSQSGGATPPPAPNQPHGGEAPPTAKAGGHAPAPVSRGGGAASAQEPADSGSVASGTATPSALQKGMAIKGGGVPPTSALQKGMGAMSNPNIPEEMQMSRGDGTQLRSPSAAERKNLLQKGNQAEILQMQQREGAEQKKLRQDAAINALTTFGPAGAVMDPIAGPILKGMGKLMKPGIDRVGGEIMSNIMGSPRIPHTSAPAAPITRAGGVPIPAAPKPSPFSGTPRGKVKVPGESIEAWGAPKPKAPEPKASGKPKPAVGSSKLTEAQKAKAVGEAQRARLKESK